MSIKLALADDHTFNRKALEYFIKDQPGYEVCASVANGYEAVRAVKFYHPDVLLLDLKMPVMDGFKVLTELRNMKNEKVKVLVISEYDNTHNLNRCIELGAKGFYSVIEEPDGLFKAIDSVMANDIYLSPRLGMPFLKEAMRLQKFVPKFNNKAIRFDKTQLTVIEGFCRELSAEEIGRQINVDRRTVEGYKEKMMDDIDAHIFTTVVIYAHRTRQIDLDAIPLPQKAALTF